MGSEEAAMSDQVVFTDDNFDQDVIKSGVPVLVDFWAPWCRPCEMIAPIVSEIASEYDGKLKVGKLNTDENQQVAARYGIMSIPTLLIFKNGDIAAKVVGAQSKQAITAKIDSALED
jgi:thioredoxin 1